MHNQLLYFKVEQKNFEKVHENEIASKTDLQTTLVFDTSISYQKETSKRPRFIVFQKHFKKAWWRFINFPSDLHKKIHRNNLRFSSIEIRLKKAPQSDVDLFPIEITSNNLRRKDLDFWPIEITFKKVDFLPI